MVMKKTHVVGDIFETDSLLALTLTGLFKYIRLLNSSGNKNGHSKIKNTLRRSNNLSAWTPEAYSFTHCIPSLPVLSDDSIQQL